MKATTINYKKADAKDYNDSGVKKVFFSIFATWVLAFLTIHAIETIYSVEILKTGLMY